jgi:hypothetical protein
VRGLLLGLSSFLPDNTFKPLSNHYQTTIKTIEQTKQPITGIKMELQQGDYTITTMLEHVNLLIGITQPATAEAGSAFQG